MTTALAIFGIANRVGSTVLCYAVARPARGSGDYPKARPLASAPQDGINRTSVEAFPDLEFVTWDKIYEAGDSNSIDADLLSGNFNVPAECPIETSATLTGTPFGPVILRYKSQERIRATGVGVIRVSGLTLSEGAGRVSRWLKNEVGEAEAPALLVKLVDWIDAQAGLPGLLDNRPRVGLVDSLSLAQTGTAVDGLLFHVSLDEPNFRTRAPLNRVHIRRHAAKLDQTYRLHITLQNFDEVIKDTLLEIRPGQQEISIEAPAHITDAELTVFGGDGEIVDYVGGSFSQGMEFGVSAIGRSDTLPPVYSGSPTSPDLENRPRLHSIASQRPALNYSAGFDAMRRNFDRLRLYVGDPRAARENVWFKSGGENQLDVIRWIKARLEKPGTLKAFLVDPFLGRDALERVVIRQGNENIALNILVSPSKAALDNSNVGSVPLSKYLSELKEAAEHWSAQLCGKISIYHIKRGDGGKQAFHDRYLCTVNQLGTPTAYLLSNSLNKAAGDWPFCICELDRVTSHRIHGYIRLLLEGNDRQRELDTSVIWESPNTGGN